MDPDFNPGAAAIPGASGQVRAIAVLPDGRILVGGQFESLAGKPWQHLGRLNWDGSLDQSFHQIIMPTNRFVSCLALQADGKILVGGRFQTWDGSLRRFGRLNADGTPDTTFLNDISQAPNFVDQGETVHVLASQNDGRLLVGGRFTFLGGRYFNVNNVGRLPAMEPPQDELKFANGTITWLRGGASPEIWRATFEHSVDGTSWTPPGVGHRVAGGWQIAGISAPKGTFVRARGAVVTGGVNVWFAQTIATVPNRPPVPDARATVASVLSPNGTNATVILDGSRSSDPDGDALSYSWYEAGNRLAEGAVAVVKLPVGNHPVRLVVHDGEVDATYAIQIEVLTASQAVGKLLAMVTARVSRPQPLQASLCAAISALERGNLVPAVNQLLAFQNKVRTHVARQDPVLADTLIRTSQQIMAVLQNGPGPAHGRLHGRFNQFKKAPDGKVRMEFVPGTDGIYIVEASSDMVHWERIGVATPQANGSMAFEDKPARNVVQRFYRVVRLD